MTKICPFLLAVYVVVNLCGCGGNVTSTVTQTNDDLLKGTWEVTSATINGELFPVEGQPDIHIGGRYRFDSETLTKYPNPNFPGVDHTATPHRYQVDAKTNPKQIEIQVLRDGSRGPWPPEKTIFRLEKDSLVLCWSIFGETIPKTFESNAGVRT